MILLRGSCFLLLSLLAAHVPASTPSAVSLIEGMEQILWSESNHGHYVMRIESEYWTRELQLEAWMERPERTLIRIHSPKKEAGVGSLRIGDAMWNYLPKVDRTIKIPPSMMLQPWMGSNFSNDDLVKESSFVDDYAHELGGVDNSGEIPVYRIVSAPNADAPVVWSRLEFEVRADAIPISVAYYGERGQLVKRLTYEQVKIMDGRRIPTLWTMVDANNPESRTVIRIESIEFDVPLDESLFSLRRLRNPE
ncbi:outer membrane lipoprotein-sorting protein [Marinobacter shengliensis]|uniref:outer membrane lipoprotein-sorting protein n=1 Tax=Marinobacter shengliensis TaxID=1389223 RepID=UPI002573FE13|nr:outer membrane lipoprotein-sorting protein [Marinobacter shengliensis]BEH15775.1 outer membrane lipoprotein-sorting protein [Marinobacter shengliensis]